MLKHHPIGPIFSTSVEAIEKDAKANQITVISLSNNQQLIGKINNEGGIFIAGMLPEAQIDKIVNYSLQKAKFSFAAFLWNQLKPTQYYDLDHCRIMIKLRR